MWFTLPSDFASTTLAQAGVVVQPFVPLIELVTGVVLAVVVIALLIGILIKH